MSDANDKLDRLLGDTEDPSDGGWYGRLMDSVTEEDLPEWAMEALANNESVTVRGYHQPASITGPPYYDFEEAVEHFKGEVADPEAMAGALVTGGEIEVEENTKMARTRTPTHPNCRSTTVTVDGEIDGEEDAIREAIEKLAEETVERSKNLLKR